MDELEKQLVPGNTTGMQSNTEGEKEFDSEDEASSFFAIAKQRLLQPNKWHEYAGSAAADFQLTDEKGNPVDTEVKEGFHFRIDIPGPGTGTGEGYDWVQVEKISEVEKDNEKIFTIQVRPATNPLNEKQDVAHFFTDAATSSFMVSKKGRIVKAAVYGRNEKPNTKAEDLKDKARNTVVATGAISGMAKLQWNSLVKGVLGS